MRDCWQAAKEAKVKIEREMIDALRQKNGEYGPDKLAAIQEQGGSAIFMMLTDEVFCGCSVAYRYPFSPADDKPWGTKPTPVPDLAPEEMIAIQQRLAQETQAEIREGTDNANPGRGHYGSKHGSAMVAADNGGQGRDVGRRIATRDDSSGKRGQVKS